jgi:hypothetical protein
MAQRLVPFVSRALRSAYSGRRKIAARSMRPNAVVIVLPGSRHSSGDRGEQRSVEQLVAKAGVEALDEGPAAEFRNAMEAMIAERLSQLRQPADGKEGPRGEAGPAGKLNGVRSYVEGAVHCEGDIVVREGSTH